MHCTTSTSVTSLNPQYYRRNRKTEPETELTRVGSQFQLSAAACVMFSFPINDLFSTASGDKCLAAAESPSSWNEHQLPVTTTCRPNVDETYPENDFLAQFREPGASDENTRGWLKHCTQGPLTQLHNNNNNKTSIDQGTRPESPLICRIEQLKGDVMVSPIPERAKLIDRYRTHRV
ncbi:hypothetical protein ElyMa_004046900 [Elysia marginata]|uniref:Uncharacterized protein n=1 Tax=Elysia marginata TaxID=1093978 RepID=A0AAV4G5J6_9GAST|nr:hypothetical protein ElyMa_004046900 [Elysia marginata]